MKIVILGDSYVGKTAILRRLKTDEFQDHFKNTISSEMTSLELEKENKTYKFMIWDTAGSEKYRAVSRLTLQGADAVILVYDVSNEESFLSLNEWNQIIENNCREDTVCIMIGNKSDVTDKRKVSFEDGLTGAMFMEMEFAEMSPKSQSSCQLKQIFLGFFYRVIEKFRKRYPEQTFEKDIVLKEDIFTKQKKKGCFSSFYQKLINIFGC